MVDISLEDLRKSQPHSLEEARALFRRDLDRSWETSSAPFPNLGMEREEFDRRVLAAAAEIAEKRSISVSAAIAKRMRFPDFYLACAALSENSKVSSRGKDLFTRRFMPLTKKYVATRWKTVPNAEDRVNMLFFCMLYEHTLSEKTGNPSRDTSLRPPLLTEYRGQGPLAAWLTLSLGNMIRDRIRTRKDQISMDQVHDPSNDGSALPIVEPSVEEVQRTSLDRDRCVKMLQEGLGRGWNELKPREQLTLVLQTLMQVPPSVIARKIMKVHEGTITKYTTNGLKKLRDAIESYGCSQARMTAEEVEGCFEYLREAFPETPTLDGGLIKAATERS